MKQMVGPAGERPPLNYRGVRVALLGASGFIGQWVAQALSAVGAELYLLVRDVAAAARTFRRYGVQGRPAQIDLLDEEGVAETLRRLRPSVTFNLAGYGVDSSERDERIAFRINGYLVRVIGSAMAAVQDPDWRGQDLVHVGSALEYGTSGGDLNEDSAPQPTTVYGRSKLLGTQLLMECCASTRLKGVTARLFTVYGPGEHAGRLLPSLLQAARTRAPLQLTDGRQRRDFTYVQDAADGLIRLGLAEASPGEIVNVATGRLASVREFVETAARLLEIPAARLVFGAVPTRPEEMCHDAVNVARARELLGWIPPTGVDDGIRQTVAFETTVARYREE